jgi:hypothetical protein
MSDGRDRRTTVANVTRRHRATVIALVAAALSASGWATNSQVAVSAPTTLMHAGAVERNATGHDVVTAVEPSAPRSFARLDRRDLEGTAFVLVAQLAIVRGVRNSHRYGVVPDLTPANVRGLLAGDVAGRAPPAS